MRKFVIHAVLLASTCLSIGCVMPIYSSDKPTRAKQLINTSESLRHIPEIWERIWGLETPDFATPYRVHGGVI